MSFSKKGLFSGSCAPTATTTATTTTNHVRGEKLSPICTTASPNAKTPNESRRALKDVSNFRPSATNLALPDASPKVPAFLRLYEQGKTTLRAKSTVSPPSQSESRKSLPPAKPLSTKPAPRTSPKNSAAQASSRPKPQTVNAPVPVEPATRAETQQTTSSVQIVNTLEVNAPSEVSTTSVSSLEASNTSEPQAVPTRTSVEARALQSTLHLATVLQTIQGGITRLQAFERVVEGLIKANGNAPSTLLQDAGLSSNSEEEKMERIQHAIQEIEKSIQVLHREIEPKNNDNDNNNHSDNSKEDQTTVVPTSSVIEERDVSRTEVVQPLTGGNQEKVVSLDNPRTVDPLIRLQPTVSLSNECSHSTTITESATKETTKDASKPFSLDEHRRKMKDRDFRFNFMCEFLTWRQKRNEELKSDNQI